MARESYVKRTERALVETTILRELQHGDALTLDDLTERVRRVGGWDEKVDDAFVRDSVSSLAGDGHVREADDRYTITDDGKEDVQKIRSAVAAVNAELKRDTRQDSDENPPGPMSAQGI